MGFRATPGTPKYLFTVIEIMVKGKETYFVEAEGSRWAVRRHELGGKQTLCIVDNQNDAEQIQIAMNVMPVARQAAEELADQDFAVEGPGQRALVAIFSRLKAQERQALFLQDMRSCITGMGNFFLAVLAGIGLLAVLILIFRFLVM